MTFLSRSLSAVGKLTEISSSAAGRRNRSLLQSSTERLLATQIMNLIESAKKKAAYAAVDNHVKVSSDIYRNACRF